MTRKTRWPFTPSEASNEIQMKQNSKPINMNGSPLLSVRKGIIWLAALLSLVFMAYDRPIDPPAKTFPTYGNWTSITKADGLPSSKAYCVRVAGDRVLVGTHAGLAVLENGTWKTYTTEDGLVHNGVLSIDVSELTGDVWVGTMGGLSRWSAGRFENFTQLNSGMPNDLIYSVTCDGREVWMATAGGAGRYDTFEETWLAWATNSHNMTIKPIYIYQDQLFEYQSFGEVRRFLILLHPVFEFSHQDA